MTNERAAAKAPAPREQPVSEIIPLREDAARRASQAMPAPSIDEDDLYANVACTD